MKNPSWLLFVLVAFVVLSITCLSFQVRANDSLKLMTWNVRGYPERVASQQRWFTDILAFLHPQVLCIQEITDQDRVNQFLATQQEYTKVAFENSPDPLDNAIFFTDSVQVIDLPDPAGFQHPAQAAYFCYQGLDAVIITVHLPWKDKEERAKERELLVRVVKRALDIDPDVILAGDFNTTRAAGDTIEGLTQSLGFRALKQLPPNIGTTYGKYDYYHAGYRYDHILVSPDLYNEESCKFSYIMDIRSSRQIAESVSNHRPVETWFSTDIKYHDHLTWPLDLSTFSWPLALDE